MFFYLLHFCCVGKKIVSVSHNMQDTSLVKYQVLASLFRSYSSTQTHCRFFALNLYSSWKIGLNYGSVISNLKRNVTV